MRYGSVCSGIEAATMAWHPLGWTPAFFSEIEAFPSAVLAHHYGSNMPGEPPAKNGIPNYGDFTQIGADAGPIDLLVGGTPCQSFSVAGKRLGLDDPRGNLALEYLSLARRLRARWIVWENVPGVVSSVTDEEDGEGGVRSGIEGREAGDEWIEESDFATFLSFVRECGYGFAYRVLDAQYVRVDGFGRAVPQRRRRVFVVGYLGDWRRAATVLLEPQGMRGDSAPRREPGKRVAPTIASRPTGGGGLGTDFDLDGGLLAFGGGNTSGAIDVSTALTAHGQRQDFEVETFIASNCKASGQNGFGVGEIAPTLRAMDHLHGNQNAGGQIAVAHTLKGEGFDASEDGTGRGTPIIPVAPFTLAIRGRGDSHQLEYRQDGTANAVLTPNGGRAGIGVGAIAFDTTQITSAANYSNPKAGEPCHPLASGAHPPAIAFDAYNQSVSDVSHPLRVGLGNGSGDEIPQTLSNWAVRRLTPTECERLQGFPDNYTNVPWNRKDNAPDGPRYKALGNSMAVNVMRWIGKRIQMVEDVCSGLEAAE